MTNQHPITPPLELVDSIWNQFKTGLTRNLLTSEAFREAITKASQWGADQELEACCEWVDRKWSGVKNRELRTTRRPKPPSLKEQAIAVLENAGVSAAHYNILLRGLEQLDD